VRRLLRFAPVVFCSCAFFRQLAGTNTVDLEKADVRSMGVDLRKQQKTICPRERVQMAVFMDVVLSGDKEAKKVETWQGKGGNKNGRLDFEEFAFASSAGRFDRDGWFFPNDSLLATVSREIEIKTVYKRRPDKFTLVTTYKPDYDCIKQTGRDGEAGSAGATGAAGMNGSQGSDGAYTTTYNPPTTPGGISTTTTTQGPGGNGGNGTNGGPGGNGGVGAPGPRLTVSVALVKTTFYDKLVAVRITGDVDDLLLFPPEVVLSVHANGGAGGSGGNGGHGGQGGAGGSGNPPGSRGADGANGPGGAGGAGGAGGEIDLFFDAAHEADLRAAIDAQAKAGPGGAGGSGSGGGGRGRDGPQGRVTWRPADVHQSFGYDGMSVL
jgi:hypothetical protein